MPLPPIDLTIGNEALLYQDSTGGTHWNQPGTTFPGWRHYVAPFKEDFVLPRSAGRGRRSRRARRRQGG